MIRSKKFILVLSTFLVIAVAAVSMAFAGPQVSRLLPSGILGSKTTAPIQLAVLANSGSQLAWDCPGCPGGGG